MTQIATAWDSIWSATSIASSTVTNGSNATTAAISNDTKVGTEISVTVAYGGTATQGVLVNVLRMVDDSPTFESATNDAPWGFAMPFATSTTFHRTFTVPSDRISKFKVYVANSAGASVTATVNYRQFTISLS